MLAPVKTVRQGALKIDIRAYSDGRFGFDYRPQNGMREQVRCSELEQAEQRAREIVGASNWGKVDRLSIDDDEFMEFLQWKSKKRKKVAIPDLVKAFMASKLGKGKSPYHTDRLQADLDKFADAFPKATIDEPDSAQVEKWLNDFEVGPRRWNNIRSHVVSLYCYARRQTLLPAEKTPVELIERRKVTVEITTYTPAEIKRLIKAVREPRQKTTVDWLPYIILGAFAGCRPEELAPDKKAKKPRLQWKDIKWDRKKIDMPKKVSKDNNRRFIPLQENVLKWLEPYRNKTGDIIPEGTRATDQYKTWSESSKVTWKSDALRHSYASYRLAVILDMERLRLEMGNSVKMIKDHYLDLKHEDEAAAYFAIAPDEK